MAGFRFIGFASGGQTQGVVGRREMLIKCFDEGKHLHGPPLAGTQQYDGCWVPCFPLCTHPARMGGGKGLWASGCASFALASKALRLARPAEHSPGS